MQSHHELVAPHQKNHLNQQYHSPSPIECWVVPPVFHVRGQTYSALQGSRSRVLLFVLDHCSKLFVSHPGTRLK